MNSVHETLLNKLRMVTTDKDGKLTAQFISLTDEQIIRMMFLNYRGKEKSRGMRLTNFGLQIMKEFFKGIAFPVQKKISTVHILYLEKTAKFPYYFSDNELIVFDDMLGFKLKLADGDIDTLIKIEKTEVQN